jgi:EpsI family protein
LALTIPPPSIFVYKISLPLQIMSSQLAVMLLQLLGYAVNRQGNIIDLGHTELQVVAACSGLRCILVLLAAGSIFCYFYQRRPWKVAILLMALIPAALITNAVRLAAAGIIPFLQEGFWHSFSGWLIFLATFGLLILLNRVLNLIDPPDPPDLKDPPNPATYQKPAGGARPPLIKYLTAALVVVLIGIGLFRHSLVFAAIPLRQSFHRFPLQLGPWQGKHDPVDPEIIQATFSDAHLNAGYRNTTGKEVSLWIAYYAKDESGGGFKHTPRHCMVGGGWEILAGGVREIAPGHPVDYLVMQSLGNRVLVYSWQLWHGQWVTEKKLTEPYLIWDGLARHRNDGAMIRLITPVSGGLQEAEALLMDFARLLLPILPEFISYHQPQNH